MTDQCPGTHYFDKVEGTMQNHVEAVKVEVREYTKSVNDLCGQMKVLIKVICWAFIPAIVCICAIAMGEKLFSKAIDRMPIPAAHAEDVASSSVPE